MTILSASRVDAAMKCIGSVTLQAYDSQGKDAEWGTAADSYVTRAQEIGRDAALAEITNPEYRSKCESIDVEGIPKGAEPQVACAWDPITGLTERLSPRHHRDYRSDDRIYGTYDWVGMIGDATLLYWDVKSGCPKPAIESWQLRAGAVMLSSLPGVWIERARLGHLKLGWNGKWFQDAFEVDAREIAGWADELRALWERKLEASKVVAAGGLPPLTDGSHCRYCPALRGCPSRMALVKIASQCDWAALAKYQRTKPEDLALVFGEKMREMKPEELGSLFERLDIMVKVLSAAKDVAKDIARTVELPTPDGRVLREVDWPVTEVDAAIVAGVLEAKYGHDVAKVAIKTSQSGIEDALRDIAPRGKLAAMKREVMTEIDTRGGITKKTTKQVRLVSAQEKPKAIEESKPEQVAVGDEVQERFKGLDIEVTP